MNDSFRGAVSRSLARLTVALLALVVLAACSSDGGDEPPSTTTTTFAALGRKLDVVVTTPQLLDLARVIGGDRVNVRGLVKPDIDIRTYEMSAADVTAIANADLILQNGLGLEPWFDTFIKTAERRGTIVNSTAGVLTRRASNNKVDPYVWMSPSNARVITANIRKAFVAADPANTAAFEANERGYSSQLGSVISYVQQVLSPFPQSPVASVDEPLNYFCDEFNLLSLDVPIDGINAKTGPTPAQLGTVVTTLTRDKPKVVFVADSISSSASELITAQTGVKVVGGTDALRGDTLGRPGDEDNKTYLAMIRHTADVIAANLR